MLYSIWHPSGRTRYNGLVCPHPDYKLDGEDFFSFTGRDYGLDVPWTAFFTNDESRSLSLIWSKKAKGMTVRVVSEGLIPRDRFDESEFYHETCDGVESVHFKGN